MKGRSTGAGRGGGGRGPLPAEGPARRARRRVSPLDVRRRGCCAGWGGGVRRPGAGWGSGCGLGVGGGGAGDLVWRTGFWFSAGYWSLGYDPGRGRRVAGEQGRGRRYGSGNRRGAWKPTGYLTDCRTVDVLRVAGRTGGVGFDCGGRSSWLRQRRKRHNGYRIQSRGRKRTHSGSAAAGGAEASGAGVPGLRDVPGDGGGSIGELHDGVTGLGSGPG